MAEYIEREEVMKILSRYGCQNGASLGRHSGAVEAAEYEVSLLPAVDVALVVHGRWEWYADGGYKCTSCGRVFWHGEYNTVNPNYCSNCGAKMDLEVDNG